MKSFLDRFRREKGDEPAVAAPPVEPAPRTGGPPVRKPPGSTSNGPAPASAPAASEAAAKEDDALQLELGDFLHWIPQHYLKEGPHDVHAVLRFDLGSIAERATKGQATVPLAEIHRQVPQIFRADVRGAENIE